VGIPWLYIPFEGMDCNNGINLTSYYVITTFRRSGEPRSQTMPNRCPR